MVNQLMLVLMAPDYLEREVFCGASGPFMQAVRDALSGLGFPIDRYHQESFGASPHEAKAVPDDVHPQDDLSAEVTFAASGVTQPCAQTDTILATARAAGLNITSGCSMGICGTCRVRKLSGTVHMIHNGGITDDDIDDGFILAWCSRPLGAVAVDV